MDTILPALTSGLPVLILQFAVTLGLLAIGAALYGAITPFHELGLIRQGNTAAGVVFAGTLVALAIPLAATLATSSAAFDINDRGEVVGSMYDYTTNTQRPFIYRDGTQIDTIQSV